MRAITLQALALTTALATQALAQPEAAPRSFRFAVVGHIRGEWDHALNPKLGELIERVRALRPEFVVLTGDIVWGDLFGRGDSDATATPPDTAVVRREWEAVDSALATLRVPVYRVPGNHDISDLGTKRVWWQRYGALPAVREHAGSRFILLGSAWIPDDDESVRQLVARPVALDSAQTAWLRSELGRPGFEHSFIAMHHMLWWEPDAPWWREIHPLLRPAGVRVVFAGDYGPLKFSHLTRDSVLYVQASLEGLMSATALRAMPRARMLSAQFDNFLLVTVAGPRVEVEVETVAEWSSPQFIADSVRAMLDPAPPPAPGGWRKWVEYLFTPRKLAALGALGLAFFATGVLVGRRARKAAR